MKNEILKTVITHIENRDPMEYKFNGAGRLKFLKIVGWADDKALGFLTRTIANIDELWERAKLTLYSHPHCLYAIS